MPFRMFYIPSKRCFTVRSALKRPDGSRKVYAKCTTKEKAQRQIGILRTIVFGPNTKKRTIKKKKTKTKKTIKANVL